MQIRDSVRIKKGIRIVKNRVTIAKMCYHKVPYTGRSFKGLFCTKILTMHFCINNMDQCITK